MFMTASAIDNSNRQVHHITESIILLMNFILCNWQQTRNALHSWNSIVLYVQFFNLYHLLTSRPNKRRKSIERGKKAHRIYCWNVFDCWNFLCMNEPMLQCRLENSQPKECIEKKKVHWVYRLLKFLFPFIVRSSSSFVWANLNPFRCYCIRLIVDCVAAKLWLTKYWSFRNGTMIFI